MCKIMRFFSFSAGEPRCRCSFEETRREEGTSRQSLHMSQNLDWDKNQVNVHKQSAPPVWKEIPPTVWLWILWEKLQIIRYYLGINVIFIWSSTSCEIFSWFDSPVTKQGMMWLLSLQAQLRQERRWYQTPCFSWWCLLCLHDCLLHVPPLVTRTGD